MRLSSLVSFAAGLAFLCLPAQAQNITVQFKVMSLGADFTGLIYKTGKDYKVLKRVPILAIENTVYTYTGPNKMGFYQPDGYAPQTDPKAPPVPLYKDRGSITFPSSGAYVLYLSAQNDGTVSGVAMSSSLGDFPAGSFRIINASSSSLTLNIAGKATSIRPASAIVMSFGNTDSVLIRVLYGTGDSAQEVANGNFNSVASQRSTIIIYQTGGGPMPSFATVNMTELDPNAKPANASASSGTGRQRGTGRGNGGGGG